MRISPGLSGCMLALFVATASAAPPVEKVSVSTLISHGIEPSASSAIDVELPELDQGADVEIVPDNLKAIATIYYSYQLEELKLFAVVDEIVRQFESGLIPVGSGDKDVLYRYTKNTGKRLSAATRARMPRVG